MHNNQSPCSRKLRTHLQTIARRLCAVAPCRTSRCSLVLPDQHGRSERPSDAAAGCSHVGSGNRRLLVSFAVLVCPAGCNSLRELSGVLGLGRASGLCDSRSRARPSPLAAFGPVKTRMITISTSKHHERIEIETRLGLPMLHGRIDFLLLVV